MKYATQASSTNANLAAAFHAQCHVNTSTPDWYVDSRATSHMTPSQEHVTNPIPYLGNAKVTNANGNVLLISHTGSSMISNVHLKDILIVPNIAKNLLSINKLRTENR